MQSATVPVTRLLHLRARALRIVSLLLGILGLVGAASAAQLAWFKWDWVPMAMLSALCLWIFPLVVRAERMGDQTRLRRLGLAVVITTYAVLLQRMGIAMYSHALDDPTLSLFRPVYAFVPVIFIVTLAILPATPGLATCWAATVVIAIGTGYGVWSHTGFALTRDGELMLLIWAIVGNPLTVLILHALPQFEHMLADADSQVQEMRERAALLEQVKAGEQRFNMVIESLQVGVWDQTYDHGLLVGRWWSPKYYGLLGYTAEELPACEASAQRIFGDQLIPVREAIFRDLREKGISNVDTKFLTKDRGWRWFNISSVCERDAQGRFTRITGSIEDIHDRRVAESALLEAQSTLRDMAYRDALTHLHNRRAFTEQLQREWERAKRERTALSVMVIDLDFFKQYNDRYGHPMGDEALRRSAQAISKSISRPGDLAARMGGEEFVVLLPGTLTDGALQVGLELEQNVRALRIPHEASPLGILTCSVGIATLTPQNGGNAELLIEQADKALYRAKQEGRARVSVLGR